MQVTGSNRDKNRSTRLSIRIPNGQSLHRDTLSVGAEVTDVEIAIEGCGVVPYPKSLFEEGDLRAMMEISGVAMEEGDQIVTIHTEGSVSFALRLSQESTEAIEALRKRGVNVALHTPLEGVLTRAIIGTRRPKTVVLRIEEGVAYTAVSVDKRVKFVEAMPVGSAEGVVNLLAHLNQDFNLSKARFILLGESSAQHYKTIKKYFRRVRCEK